MDGYQEVLKKCEGLSTPLMKSNINSENIKNCLMKLNALSDDLDIVAFYIRDLTATATEKVTTRQTTCHTLHHTPKTTSNTIQTTR